MAQEYIPFSEIVTQLKGLCRSRVTGTLFIATKKNRSAQVMIESGEIVFMYFYNKRGQEALELMATIEAGTCRFQEGSVPSRRGPMPETSLVLQTLAGSSRQDERQLGAAQAVSVGENSLSRDQKTVLEECLVEFIGPMAAIICEDHFGSAVDFQTTIDFLAGEIPSAEQGVKFKEKVISMIG